MWNVFSTLIQFIHELAPRSLWFLIDTAYREPYQTVSTVYFIIVVLRARVEVGSQKPEVGRPFSAFVVSSCIWIKVQINVQTTLHFQFNSLGSSAQFEILWWFDVTSETKQTVQETQCVHSKRLKLSPVMKKITQRDFLVSASATLLTIECEPGGQW